MSSSSARSTNADAHSLLAAHGVADETLARELVEWAGGWPLALSLAAGSTRAGAPAAVGVRRRDVLRAVVGRVVGSELAAGDRDVVAIAAIARSVTPRMLRAVLPEADADAAMTWLRGLSFAEGVGTGVALHDLMRRAIRAELEERDPERARQLRRSIADNLHELAVAGEPRMIIDLTELIDDRALRWGLGAEASSEYRIDSVRPGDVEALAPYYATRPRWWRDIRAFLEGAPERVVLARDERDRLAGISIAVTLVDAPPCVEDDAVLARWLTYARDNMPDADVLLWRDATDLGRNADPASPVVSLMNTAAILNSGLANVRYSYIPLDPPKRGGRALLAQR